MRELLTARTGTGRMLRLRRARRGGSRVAARTWRGSVCATTAGGGCRPAAIA